MEEAGARWAGEGDKDLLNQPNASVLPRPRGTDLKLQKQFYKTVGVMT